MLEFSTAMGRKPLYGKFELHGDGSIFKLRGLTVYTFFSDAPGLLPNLHIRSNIASATKEKEEYSSKHQPSRHN